MQKKQPRKIPVGRAIAKKGEKFNFNYKDAALLARFIGESGTIMSRERTGLSSKQQRELGKAIKQARHVALLPFVTTL